MITPDLFTKSVQKAGEGKGIDHINRVINCPIRYAHVDPAGMDQQIKDWFTRTEGKGSLFVHGSVGTGKTHSVLALAKLLYVNGIKVKAYNIIEFLDSIKAQFSKPDCDIKTILTDERLLILDDFGVEKATEWTQEIIYRLINLRYENMLQTIFISNLSITKLSSVYGDRIASRITEMVGGKDGIIKITGQDRRIKGEWGDESI